MTSREVYEKCEKFYEKARQNPKVWVGLVILLAVILLIWLPPWRVSHFEINNATVEADLENQYRATLAQILGGGAVLIGIYFAWKNFELAQATLKSDQEKFQKNFELAQESQITERFTRAVDQLGAVDQSGNPTLEIRLSGIDALEKLANKCKGDKDDDWPIIDILTAYLRKNSSIENEEVKNENSTIKKLIAEGRMDENEIYYFSDGTAPILSSDTQAILTVIRRYNFNGPSCLDLHKTYLRKVDFQKMNLREANLKEADLGEANLKEADLQNADISDAKLLRAYLFKANLQDANLVSASPVSANFEEANLTKVNLQDAKIMTAIFDKTNLEKAKLNWADLTKAYFINNTTLVNAQLIGATLVSTHFIGANLEGANFEGANLKEANLKGAKNLTIDQLSKVKTLYNAKLDPELEVPLREKYPALFEKPDE